MGLQFETDRVSPEIAVVGLACRFPGGASGSAKLWDLLYQCKSAHSQVPLSRFNVDAFHHAAGDKLNTLSCRGGHFLDEDVSAFDAPFFNITANEAKGMDPTARMLLEVTYEALENAGLPIEGLAGSDTSCYVGCFTRDYHEMLMRDAESSPMYAGTGTGFSLLSNRVSWFYDFRGPSMTLDTACSSSLVGMHLACQSLRAGESKLAVVCGANLILSPDLAMWLSNLHMLSKDGLSKSFAEGASGYGRGEGIATVVLKPLADALRDGDSVRAVIRGTGVNQDGHTTGITMPNSDAQADLIRSTYRSAGLDFSQTTYFEAHGTGTAVGDPLELAAVARTLTELRQPGDELFVGSIKSNIGHLEGAAGLAGVIKCILMLESGTILPNIHFDKPNRRIPFEQWKIRVPTSPLPWPADRLRRVSVNSFGYGGTNAHAILDDASQYLAGCALQGKHNSRLRDTTAHLRENGQVVQRQRLFVFSAHDEAALDRLRNQFKVYLDSVVAQFKDQSEEDAYLERVAFTLSNRRSRLDWKTYATGSTVEQLRESLLAPTVQSAPSSTEPRLIFVFTGQGAQWAKMGLELIQYPVFRDSIRDAERYLKEKLFCEWSVMEELARDGGTSRIQLARFSQPICTVLQVALVDLLTSWRIKPVAVIGHSSGEIAAACCYGAISREDAWTISYWRGKLCSELTTEAPQLRGSMMAVGLSRAAIQGYVSALTQGKVVVACVNSPDSVTVSGDKAAIDELYDILEAGSVFCRRLKVENAYHSHHMKLIAERYLDCISNIRPMASVSTSDIKMASSVTGSIVKHSDLGPEYWVQNLVSPVLFLDAVKALSKSTTQRRRRAREVEPAFDLILEVGPHAALKGPLRQILQEQDIKDITYLSVLLRGEDAIKTALATAGTLYIHGAPVAISCANGVLREPVLLIDLPSYPWNHSLKYWSESRLSHDYRMRPSPRHDLVGAPALGSHELEPRWRHFLRVNENPWIRDHMVHSSILYPGAGILAMPIQAIQQMADKHKQIDSIQLRDVHITKAIVVPDDQLGVETFLQMRRQRSGTNGGWTGWYEFSVLTCYRDQDIEENSFGMVRIQYKSDDNNVWATGRYPTTQALKEEYSSSKNLCTHQVEPKDFYKATEEAGLRYGPTFQGLTEITAGKGRCCVAIAVPNTKKVMPASIESPHLIHPTTLDIIFHSLFAALGDGELNFQKAAVPVSIDSLMLSMDLPSGAGATFIGFCHATRDGPRELVADICMSDKEWTEPKVRINGIRCRELPGRDMLEPSVGEISAPLGTLVWKPDIELMENGELERYVVKEMAEEEHMGVVNGVTNGVTNGVMNSHHHAASLKETLCKIIDLIAHKSPDISILQLGEDKFSLSSSILSILASDPAVKPRLSSYVFADTNSKVVEEAETVLKAWKQRVSFHVMDKEHGPRGLGLRDGSFDIVVVTDEVIEGMKIKDCLSDVERLVRAGGKLLILGTTGRGQSCDWKEVATAAGLRTLGVIKENAPAATLVVATNLSTAGGMAASDMIFVLEPASTNTEFAQISAYIVTSLQSKGLRARRVTWPPELSELDGKPIISLLELERSMLSELSSEDYSLLKRLVLQSSHLLWVSMGNDPIKGAAVGYLRVLKNENPTLNPRYLLLEDRADRTMVELAHTIAKVALAANEDREFVEMDGYICINRWMPDDKMSWMTATDGETGPYEYMPLGEARVGLSLIIDIVEELGSFYFTIDTTSNSLLGEDEVEIEVKAIAPRSLQSDASSVKEISGIVTRAGGNSQFKPGDRVCAAGTGPYGTVFRTKVYLCLRIPEETTFEEAATWPITLGTAYQSLVRIARLREGQSILIQDAASPVGLAAIWFANLYHATVYATTRTREETNVLESYGIDGARILGDADPSLRATVDRVTCGRGFDVIINASMTGERFRQLWHCTAPFGVFVDVSGLDASNSSSLDMLPFQRGASFSVVNMDFIVQQNPCVMGEIMLGLSLLPDNNSIGPVRPLSVFGVDRIADAFGALRTQNTLGKVVVSFKASDRIPVALSAVNPLLLVGNATYVLAGGLGGLGRSLTRLLVANGARHLVFLSRSGPASPIAQSLLQELTTAGVVAKIYACDISDEAAMANVIAQCIIEMPPIRGVIQSAAVLNDSIYELMSHSQWQNATRPKIQGTWNMHALLPKNMDFFVMLSSIAGVVGNRSQANYAAGNTFQDALARYRRKLGLPAVSVDLGLMLGIGLIAERGGVTNLRRSEAVGLLEPQFHAILKSAMAGSFGRVPVPDQLVSGLPTGGILKRGGLDIPFYFADPRFSFLRKMDLDKATVSSSSAIDGEIETESLVARLAQTISFSDATKLITEALCARLAKGLQTGKENINPREPLHKYGVDSLVAVEIRNWTVLNTGIGISLFDVLGTGSIRALAERVAMGLTDTE